MREILIAGNWKMNGSIALIGQMMETLRSKLDISKPPCSIAICPPYLYAAALQSAVEGTAVAVGVQNVYTETQGAYTGETSAPIIKECGIPFCIVGHSERRTYFGETDKIVNQKAKILLDHGIRPIICVGETLEQRESGNHEAIVIDQVKKALEGFSKDQLKQSVLAYEPIWAIGTGKTATPEQANQMHKVIRKELESIGGSDIAQDFTIQYGGSVNAKNAKELLGQPDIDGALVGGASLKPDDFVTIILAVS